MFLIGLNYWSKKGGPLMWREFDRATIEREMEQIKSLGVDVIRAFAFWPDFQKSPETIDPAALAHAREFLDAAYAHGVKVYFTFIVGHMSGENWDPVWKDRDFFQLQKEEELYVSTLVSSLKDHPALAGWILSNELPIYASSSEETVASWIKRMSSLVKSIDPSHPLGTGDGYWGVLGPSPFNPFDYADAVDYHGPHSYTPDSDGYRQSVFPQFFIKVAKVDQKPVILEEFGASSVLGADERIAGYYRVVLSGALAAGASGAWGWCYSDFDLANQRPYSHHPHELGFGVTTVDWQVKPQGEEIRKFAAFLDRNGLREAKPSEDEVGILVPSYIHENYPFTSGWEARNISLSLQSSFSMLLQNRVNPKIAHEPALPKEVIDNSGEVDVTGWPKLMFMPYAIRYTAKTQRAVKRFLKEGGSIVLSYGFGAWYDIRALGIEADVHYNHPVEFEEAVFERDDTKVSVRPAQLDFDASVAPVSSGEALVKDQKRGLPLLVKVRVGAGRVYFITFPFERWLSSQARPFETSDPHLLYRYVLDDVGLRDPHEKWSKWVQAVKVGKGELIINHSWEDQLLEGYGPLGWKAYALL